MVLYGLVLFEEETSYDVLKMSCVSTDSGDEPSEGSQVQVRWRDKGTFQATLITISDDKQKLIEEMEEIIAQQNKSSTRQFKKSKERSQQKRQGQELLAALDAQEGHLHKENAALKREVAGLRAELKKYQRLDGYLKSAERMLELLKCPTCNKRELMLPEHGALYGDEPLGSMRELPAARSNPSATIREPPVARREPSAARRKPETADRELLLARNEPPATRREPPTANRELPLARKGPQTADRELPLARKEPPVARREPPTADMELLLARKESQVARREHQTAERELTLTRKEPQAARREPPTALGEGPADSTEPPTADNELPLARDKPPAASREPLAPMGMFNEATSSQLLHSWSDAGVVELEAGSGIFIDQGALHNIRAFCKTSTATARALLVAVFTPQALLVCSVKGNRAKGAHRPSEQRPPLNCAAMRAILAQTKAMAADNGWEYAERVVLLSIGTKLSELRGSIANNIVA